MDELTPLERLAVESHLNDCGYPRDFFEVRYPATPHTRSFAIIVHGSHDSSMYIYSGIFFPGTPTEDDEDKIYEKNFCVDCLNVNESYAPTLAEAIQIAFQLMKRHQPKLFKGMPGEPT